MHDKDLDAMEFDSPAPLTPEGIRGRRRVILKIARSLSFVGRIEYRHVFSQSGGAQYGRGVAANGDLLTVFAEAFDRDADPSDFSMTAMIAHERGHQILARHPRLTALQSQMSAAVEEVLASRIAAKIVGASAERDMLIDKAAADLLDSGASVADADRLIERWWELLGEML
jgi:hypothetical protein